MGLEFKVYLTCRLLCRGVVRFVSQPSGKNRQVEKKKKPHERETTRCGSWDQLQLYCCDTMKILKILPFLLILTEFFSQISGYDSNGANSQDSRGLEESQMASLSKVSYSFSQGPQFQGSHSYLRTQFWTGSTAPDNSWYPSSLRILNSWSSSESFQICSQATYT